MTLIFKKGKVVAVHALKAYKERRGIAPLIFNLAVEGSKWSA